VVALALLSVSPAAKAATATATFTPVADATVQASNPTRTYGTASTLLVDNSPVQHFLLKFAVSGLGGAQVVSARLRLYCTNSSNIGGLFAGTTSVWQETTVTWNNAPQATTSVVGSLGRVSSKAWVEVDVTPLVSSEGTISILVTTSSSDGASYSSREAGARAPVLVVEYNAAGGATATVTPSPTPTATPAPTPNPTATPSPTPTATPSPTPTPTATPSPTPTPVATPTATPVATPTATPVATPTATPVATPTATPTGGSDPILLAAGDIATCGITGDEQTAALLDGMVGTIAALGDEAYENGSATDFSDCYDPSWGRYKARTLPAVGNHEYQTANATGYYAYFGAVAGDPTKGYYAYTLGTWRILVLNGNCSHAGGCDVGSQQETWLRSELAAAGAMNVLAYWHQPRFSSGYHGSDATYEAFWQDLYNAGADLVLNGHDHDYERFAPQDATGTSDPAYGVREFVVGTGGAGLRTFSTPVPNSEVREYGTLGILELTLGPDSYTWRFVPVSGTFADAGTAAVHGPPPQDTEAPTAPTGLAATSVTASSISLGWTPATDNVRVTGYEVVRNGVVIGQAAQPDYIDVNVAPGQGYRYEVRARDAAGNWSTLSAPVDVATPTPSSTVSFTLEADAIIRGDNVNANYGGSTSIEVDASPLKDELLRVTVGGIGPMRVVSATLYLYCIDPSGVGGLLYQTSTAWSESTVTWATAPAASGPLVSSLGSVVAGAWYTLDLSSVITAEGTYAFRMTSTSSNGADYYSREGPVGFRPVLVVQIAP
jgi:Fibronectin type III domain/Calcineurin-like phosphoesterase